ncbi:hypothetical protein [Polymorphospora lycopeni]|uniref:Uncharacterized protein n=1 Tax=Polymorphospora lycopeni TaxID=3140240 RepID=A0ABV5CKP5_9ACTN
MARKESRWQLLAASFATGAAFGAAGTALARRLIMRDSIDSEDASDWAEGVNPGNDLDAKRPELARSIPAVDGGGTSATSPVNL